MAESWEDTKRRLKKNLGIVYTPAPEIRAERRKGDRRGEERPAVELFDVCKVTLPPDSRYEHGKVVVIGVTSREADWWIEKKLKPRVYQDDATETKTLVFYEKFRHGTRPKERNLYSNPARFCVEDFPEFNNPRRGN